MPTPPNWTLSHHSRARLNEALETATRHGIDPDAVSAGGLAALRALLALNHAADAHGGRRDEQIARVHEALTALDPRAHGPVLQQFQARVLALQGRGGDTEVAHVTLGEIVLPKALQTPAVLEALREAAKAANLPLAQFRVGSNEASINPHTDQPEFSETAPEDIEEITVTAPRGIGIVQLPQNLPDSGFYSYGTPLDGEAQYGVPSAMEVIGAAGHAWRATGRPPFGVGNMSKADLSPYDGRTERSDHSKGTGIDIRPIRSDGKQLNTRFDQPGYDREGTQKLVDTLRQTGGVETIYFNDPEIQGVSPWKGHDNHLHVRVTPGYRRPPQR